MKKVVEDSSAIGARAFRTTPDENSGTFAVCTDAATIDLLNQASCWIDSVRHGLAGYAEMTDHIDGANSAGALWAMSSLLEAANAIVSEIHTREFQKAA